MAENKTFLFQTGAIRRQEVHYLRVGDLSCFYSKLVRLEALEFNLIYHKRISFYSKLVRLEVTQKQLADELNSA